MNVNLTSTTLGARKQAKGSRKSYILAGIGAVLTLAVAAGIGAWRLADEGGDTRTATVTSGAPAAVDRLADRGGVAEQLAESRASAATTTGSGSRTGFDFTVPSAVTNHPTALLVRSQEQASQIRGALEEANAIRAQFGEPPLTYDVVVVASAEEADQFRLAITDTNAIRVPDGLPEIEVIDVGAR